MLSCDSPERVHMVKLVLQSLWMEGWGSPQCLAAQSVLGSHKLSDHCDHFLYTAINFSATFHLQHIAWEISGSHCCPASENLWVDPIRRTPLTLCTPFPTITSPHSSTIPYFLLPPGPSSPFVPHLFPFIRSAYSKVTIQPTPSPTPGPYPTQPVTPHLQEHISSLLLLYTQLCLSADSGTNTILGLACIHSRGLDFSHNSFTGNAFLKCTGLWSPTLPRPQSQSSRLHEALALPVAWTYPRALGRF